PYNQSVLGAVIDCFDEGQPDDCCFDRRDPHAPNTCHSPLYGVCERQPRNWTSLITIACGHRTQRSGNRRNSCSASETVRSPDEEVRCPRFECYMPSVRG